MKCFRAITFLVRCFVNTLQVFILKVCRCTGSINAQIIHDLLISRENEEVMKGH